ncbi:MAG: hypothetical protein BIFFINMI_03663 [Phycisphaerae bacterium]|nr:hypothetical protein [Phycisphaerae bacterium]
MRACNGSSTVAVRLVLLLTAVGLSAGLLPGAAPAMAATLYWDANGALSGSGNIGGNWNSGTNWTTDSTGQSATVAWADNSDVVFSAGTDGTGSFNVVRSGGNLMIATSVTVEEGNLTLGYASPTNATAFRVLGAFNVASGASAIFNGNIDTYGLLKTGLGTLSLGGQANTGRIDLTGYLNIQGGTVRQTSGNASPTSAAILVDSLNASTFELQTGSTVLGLGSGANGGGTVTSSGAAANTFTLNTRAGVAWNFSGALNNGTQNLAVTKTGQGTQVISGSGTFTGRLTLNSGTLVLDYSTDNSAKFGSTNPVTMRTGLLKVIGNGSAATTQTLGGLTVDAQASAGGSTLQAVSGNNQNLTLNLGAITRNTVSSNGAGTIDFVPVNTGAGVATLNTTSLNSNYGLLATSTSSGANYPAYATFNGGRDWAVKITGLTVGSAAIVGMSDPGYGGTGYTFQNNVAAWAAGQHVSSTTGGFTGTLAGDLAINSLRFNQGGTVTINSSNKLTINSGGLLVTPEVGAAATAVSGGSITGGTINELLIHQFNTAAELTVGSKITGSGMYLTKSGPGTAVLSNGSNDYTQLTKIVGGVLAVAADGALGGTANGTNISAGATLEFRAVNYTAAESITLSVQNGVGMGYNGRGAIYASGGVSQFAGKVNTGSSRFDTIGVAAGSELKLAGGIGYANGGGLGKIGAGTLTINQAAPNNSATGGFTYTVWEGAFRIAEANGSTLGSTSNPIYAVYQNAMLKLDNSGAGNNSSDRIGNEVRLNAGRFLFQGNESVNSTETTSKLTMDAGDSVVDIQRGGSQLAAMTFTSAPARNNNGTALIRGANLGASSGSNSSNLLFGANPTLTGGTSALAGYTPGTLNYQIVPYFLGRDGSSGGGNTFVTYNTARGVIPLNLATDFDVSIASATATTNNVLRAAGEDVGTATRTINSLILANAGASQSVTAGAGGLVVLTSGALLSSGAGDFQVSAPVRFGAGGTEGVVSVTGDGVLTLGQIQGTTSALTKAGAGTLALTGGTTTITGAVNVNGGKLLINAAGAAGTGNINVWYGATLGGSGSTTGTIYVAKGGSLSPGNSPGILSVGNLGMDAGANFVVDITGSDNTNLALPQYDSLVVTGTVNLLRDLGLNNYDPSLGGTVLVLNVAPNPNLTVGAILTLIRNDGSADPVLGTFAGLAQGATVSTVNGYQFQVSYVGENGVFTGGNDVVLKVTGAPTSVPEPATLALLALGGAAMVGGRAARRRGR